MISVYGYAENGILPPLETNHVIFIISTSFVPVMISCNSFPVLEGMAVPLAMHLREKKSHHLGADTEPFMNHPYTDLHCTWFIIFNAPFITTDRMTSVPKPLWDTLGSRL